MNDVDDFVGLLHDELGLVVAADEIDEPFDRIAGWDSVQLLRLMTVLERETGQGLPVAEVLQAPTLGAVYRLALR